MFEAINYLMSGITPPPTKNAVDLGYTSIKALLGLVPPLGTIAEFVSFFVASPVERRQDRWFTDLILNFERLEEHIEGFETGNAFENERFVSVFLQATHAAIINHNEENRKALRNAVLNSALATAPDEIRQKLFVQWAGELTAWHICILSLFAEETHRLPSLDLNEPQWRMNIATTQLGDIIEKNTQR